MLRSESPEGDGHNPQRMNRTILDYASFASANAGDCGNCLRPEYF